jgi:hypothetical protein
VVERYNVLKESAAFIFRVVNQPIGANGTCYREGRTRTRAVSKLMGTMGSDEGCFVNRKEWERRIREIGWDRIYK